MPTPKLPRELMQEAIKARLNAPSLTAAAKSLGLHRATFQSRLRAAEEAGLIGKEREANVSRWRPGEEIVAARKAEFERVYAARPEQFSTIHMADDRPFLLVALGDPHLDNPGTDLSLWERWINILDHRKHVHGFGLGDWLDNWVRPLSFLYATAETTAPEGWILLEYYLDKIGPHLLASVAGNHDDWSGHSDVLGMLMDKYGVRHRSKSLRVNLLTPGGHEVSIHARHRWPGRSMWNEVHGIKRAARMGQRADLMLGGDLHISGDAKEKDPLSGAISHCYQVASFKLVDDYADDKGFDDRHVSPAVALLIDPRKPTTNADRIKPYFDPDEAADVLRYVRRRAA
jgi:hypothetical protein